MHQMEDDVDGLTVHVIIICPDKVISIDAGVKRWRRGSSAEVGEAWLVLFDRCDGDLLTKRYAILFAQRFLEARIKCVFFFC